MDTKQLRTFCAIAELESFTRAGRRLGLSQSAISQQMSTLERDVGSKLLVRSGAGVRPTSAGQLLLHYARQIVRKLDEAERALADYDANGAGTLRIGAGGAACHYLLPGILEEFHERFPQGGVLVCSGHTELTMERLHNGELDVGLVTLPVSAPKLRITPVGHDELVAIVAPTHAWADRTRLHVRDFADERLLVYDRRSQTYALIERVMLEHGVFPRVVMESDHLEAVVAMVRSRLGAAIVPRWAVAAECEAGTLRAIPIGKSGLSRSWAIVPLDNSCQPKMVKAFVRLCGERLPSRLTA